ncbi:hypothetical protein ACHAXS_014116 [Conticribra weissflogii]
MILLNYGLLLLAVSSHSIENAASFTPSLLPMYMTRTFRTENDNHAVMSTVEISQLSSQFTPKMATDSETIPSNEEWTPLADNGKVCKLLLEEGTGEIPTQGCTVELEYTGTLLGEADWTTQDVAECWLSHLQGLDHLAPLFLENDIDGSKLMDTSFFTEEFCIQQLGISNKIQAKKLVMAAKRLAKQQVDSPPGTVFDSSSERGKNFSFVLGGGKAIKAINLAAGTMKVGERSKVVCRADYAYGSEGLRTTKGDVLVPPFATLCFELKLVHSEK